MEVQEMPMTTMEYVPSVIHESMNLVIVLVVVIWELISLYFFVLCSFFLVLLISYTPYFSNI
jgi:hypothetical protein